MMAKKEPCSILVKEIQNISEKYFNNKINDSGLTMSQARALSILPKYLEKRLTLKQLEKELDLAQSVNAGIVRRLERKQNIESFKNPYFLYITETKFIDIEFYEGYTLFVI